MLSSRSAALPNWVVLPLRPSHWRERRGLDPTQQDHNCESTHHGSGPSYSLCVQFKSWKDRSPDSLAPLSHSSPDAKTHLLLYTCVHTNYKCSYIVLNEVPPTDACLHPQPLFLPAWPWPLPFSTVLPSTAITVTPPNLAPRANVITRRLVVLPGH